MEKFKQENSIIKSSIEENIWDSFVKTTKEFKKLDEVEDSDEIISMKKNAFEAWSTMVFMRVSDGVQPEMSPFSTNHLIRVNYKVVSQLSQLIILSFLYLNSARYNSVIELCRALKIFHFCLRLLIKLTYSFVAIELLDFFINAKLHFYCSRELSVFELKKHILPT